MNRSTPGTLCVIVVVVAVDVCVAAGTIDLLIGGADCDIRVTLTFGGVGVCCQDIQEATDSRPVILDALQILFGTVDSNALFVIAERSSLFGFASPCEYLYVVVGTSSNAVFGRFTYFSTSGSEWCRKFVR